MSSHQTVGFRSVQEPGLSSPRMAVASTATIRAKLINIPARITYSARRYSAHLPANWPWRTEWLTLYKAVTRPKHAL